MPYKLQTRVFGKVHGNFSKAQFTSPVEFQQYLERKLRDELTKQLPIDRVVWMHCGHSQEVADSRQIRPITDYLHETIGVADGVVIRNERVAVLVLNADCPVTAVWNKESGVLAAAHCSLKSLLPDPLNLGILPAVTRRAFSLVVNRNTIQARLGIGGIKPCCYGLQDVAAYVPTSSDYRVRYGPRAKQPAIDLNHISRAQLLQVDTNWTVDETCYAHAGRLTGNGHVNAGDYHSNVWDGKDAGRNATLVWLEKV